MGHPVRRQRAGTFAPRRHRRPVGGHTRRRCSSGHPKRACRGQRSARIPDHSGHPGAAGVGVRRPAASVRHHWPGRRRRASGDRHQGTHRVAAHAARSGPGRRRRAARTGLSHLRSRRTTGRRSGVACGLADPAGTPVARSWCFSIRQAIRRARCSASSTSARWWAGRANAAH